VDNAIKYSGPSSTVSIRTAREAANARVEVADNGPGIPEAELPRIFDRFYRVDRGRNRREGGSGLGLAIVKELVTSIGGTVSASSAPGQGSTFTIVLPVGMGSSEPARQNSQRAAPSFSAQPGES
jgi:signal transduction histidine kinase